MADNNRSQWDLGRFIETLTYFEVIPFLNWIQDLFQGRPIHNKDRLDGAKQVGVILVAGATGGLGKRVVGQLLQRGYKVRSLVRDIDKARSLLGNDTELVVADITKPETLTPLIAANIQAVVCCTAVRVQPVEGDSPERAKYYQGVKFYQPEIVGDTPENVEYQGVKNLVEAVTKYLPKAGERVLFDFTNPSTELKETWGAVDDVVMGGVSQSNIQLVEGTSLFSGSVSTANSGGFASVRTKNFTPGFDLSGCEGIELRLRGDGNRYKFLLRTETQWDGVAYSYSFDTEANTWMNIRIPFADAIAVFRAKTLPDYQPIDTRKICSFQLMLSKFEYDGGLNPKFTPGGFSLQVESIKAYSKQVLPQFVLVSSAGVTRPGRPGINLDEEPPAVRLNDQLGGILTWKLKGEESLKQSGIPYTIVRPCALTEELGGKELIVAQGDNIKGKISRDDVAKLCAEVLQQSQASNVTFEVKQGEKIVSSINWQSLFSQLKPD
ncbi:NADH:ubiquinone oxidoreductase [Scytonema hofmannii PCC 7110]|uniref:NADH:ubiquinone oxidoreductase n=1 Tax=Scytonema hofmannii PCC 7110 TaxID=128403 RepID=A0A139WSZ6_9CYAN|nr:CIA30 family protein [Scytonema hofmannii]KYC35549.1 NADH:ubiquinone oxidoreductase [Scytonema hofmannii PCC 7110]